MSKQESQVNLDRLNYKTMSWRVIWITLAVEIVVFTAMNIAADGTPAIVMVPFFAVFGGWQMGVLSERNDWHKPAPPQQISKGE